MIRFATGVDNYINLQGSTMLSRASSTAHNVKEPAPCSRIATKDGLEYLEYLAVLQVPFI